MEPHLAGAVRDERERKAAMRRGDGVECGGKEARGAEWTADDAECGSLGEKEIDPATCTCGA
jgi:hypothetical protein